MIIEEYIDLCCRRDFLSKLCEEYESRYIRSCDKEAEYIAEGMLDMAEQYHSSSLLHAKDKKEAMTKLSLVESMIKVVDSAYKDALSKTFETEKVEDVLTSIVCKREWVESRAFELKSRKDLLGSHINNVGLDTLEARNYNNIYFDTCREIEEIEPKLKYFDLFIEQLKSYVPDGVGESFDSSTPVTMK